MSKTDKDRPHWVRAKDEPNSIAWHYWLCDMQWPRYGIKRQLPCDIDEPYNGRCRYLEEHQRWHSGPPHWHRRATWYDPQRNAARMDCIKAAKEFNGTGDTDVMPSIEQHRHSASWMWF